jgi:antitoxin component HigA of HigAB toxin-antitoxin module
MSYVDVAIEAVRKAARERQAAEVGDGLEHPEGTLPEALEKKRQEFGLTQAAFSALIGTNPKHYHDIVGGRRNLTLAQARRAHKLGIDAETILG